MSLKAALSAPRRQRRTSCGTAAWINALSPSEQEAAAELLASNRSHMDVFTTFQAEGYPLQYNAFLRHRIGSDSCVAG